MARKLKVANGVNLQHQPRDGRGRIAVWILGKKRWGWRSPVDVREMIGMEQATLEAPAGSPPKPTPENPFPDGVELDASESDDGDDEAPAAPAAQLESRGAVASRSTK
jgi:hypothetical protein